MGDIIRLNTLITKDVINFHHNADGYVQRTVARVSVPVLIAVKALYVQAPNSTIKTDRIFVVLDAEEAEEIGEVFEEALHPQKKKKAESHIQDHVLAKNQIATPLFQLPEMEPDEMETIFNVAFAIERHQLADAHKQFNALSNEQKRIFRYHLKMLGVENLEFDTNLRETQRALFALAYAGKNFEGVVSKYVTDRDMQRWFAPLKRFAAAEDKATSRKKAKAKGTKI